MKRKIYYSSILIIILLALDRFSKFLAVEFLQGKQPIIIIPKVFQLQYLENQGAAFGIMQGKKIFFVIITFLFIGIAIYFGIKKIPNTKRFFFLHLIDIFLIAGAMGNLIDRIWHNYVVDFFYFNLINFPIFNVADIYVTLSCIILILLILFYYKEEDINLIFSKKA